LKVLLLACVCEKEGLRLAEKPLHILAVCLYGTTKPVNP